MVALDNPAQSKADHVQATRLATGGTALLAVESLCVAYGPAGHGVVAVRDLSFEVRRGEILAIVGESGSGKTSAALAALNYLPRGGRIASGDVKLDGRSLLNLTSAERRRVYGRRIAHVAQDPSASLNAALTIGAQMIEGPIVHLSLKKQAAMRRAQLLLEEVHLSDPAKVLASYPHQLSGGMQQRVCIAMALACDPELIVMDEPTTGLDAATESAIFDLLRELRARRGLSVLFISHNLAAVRSLADRVLVMYSGRAVEAGATDEVFERPAHRYSSLLIRSLPTMRSLAGMPSEIPWQATQAPASGCPFRDRCDMATERCTAETRLDPVAPGRLSACVYASQLLSARSEGNLRTTLDQRMPDAGDPAPSTDGKVLDIEGLEHSYRKSLWSAGKVRKTLSDVSLEVQHGEVLALIGESGSGKSTLARCIVGLEAPLVGRMVFEGIDLPRRGRRPLAASRRLQIVFQNIAGSLHPGKLIREILARPFRLYEKRNPAAEELRLLLDSVGLKADYAAKLSTALSGGERQRVALARATSSEPALVVLDEAFSALDVSMKVKVMRLLLEKRQSTRLSMLLITHDLPIVRFMADRVAVLYRGWLCEVGRRSIIEHPPMHPYTELLMWSALELEGLRPRHLQLSRDVHAEASATQETDHGCPFRRRCPRHLGDICDRSAPPLKDEGGGHRVACHIPIARLRALQSAEWPSRESAEVVHGT